MIGDRLRQVREKVGLNQRDFSLQFGVNQQNLSNYERGKRDIPDSLKVKFIQYGVNIHWLLTGEGEMFISPPEGADTLTGDDSKQCKTALKSSKILILSDKTVNGIIIPFINQKVSAGSGEELDDDDTPNQLITIPRSLKRYGSLKALEVRGDSMLPTLHDHDIVVCDSGGFDGDGVYVLKTYDSEFVKRVILTSSGYQIISDNNLYPPYSEKKEDTQIIGKVRGAFLKME